MSKAFTSEETPDPVAPARELPRLRPGELRYVTPEGQAALRAELARLSASGAPPDDERTKRAVFLERLLGILTVAGPDGVPDRQVGFGTWVELEDEEGRRRTWRIVGPDEADARSGAVSALAPLGQALLGRSAGETVEVERPDGTREYTIRGVSRTAPARGPSK